MVSATLQKKRDEKYIDDVRYLIDLYGYIDSFSSATDSEAEISLLDVIGNTTKAIWHEEKDQNNIRNKYSLPLELLELLTYLEKEAKLNPNIKTVLQEAKQDILQTLEQVQENILDILQKEFVRTKPLNEELGKCIKQMHKNSQVTPNTKFDHSTPLSLFIAYFYIPKSVKCIAELAKENNFVDFDIGKMPDRYQFARNFTMIGELSKGVKKLIPEGSALYPTFQSLHQLRNSIKSNHRSFFAEGPYKIKYGDAPKFLDDFIEEVMGNKSQLTRYFDNIVSNMHSFSHSTTWVEAQKNVMEISKIPSIFPLPKDKKQKENNAIKALVKNLDGKHSQELKDILHTLTNHLDKPAAKEEIFLENLLAQYQIRKNAITPAELTKYQFPDTHNNLSSLENRNIIRFWNQLKGEPSDKVKEILQSISEIKKYNNPQEEELQYQALLQAYMAEYTKLPPVFQDEFPNPIKEDIVEFHLEEKAKAKAKQSGEDESFKPMRYYRYFEEESKRLTAILTLPETTNAESSKKEASLAHCIGILGEHIRYLFLFDDLLEVDKRENITLRNLVTDEVVSDLSQVQYVRNKQVMHGIFEYDAEMVLSAANYKALPWRFEIEAAHMVVLYAETMKNIITGTSSWELEAQREGFPSGEECAARVHFGVASAFTKLNKLNEAEECLKKAYESIAGIPNLSPEQRELFGYIEFGIATIKTKQAMNAETTEKDSLLSEAMEFLGCADTHILAENYIAKINLQNAMGSVCDMQKDPEAAIMHYEAGITIARQKGDLVIERKLQFQQAQQIYDCSNSIEGKENALSIIRDLIKYEKEQGDQPVDAVLVYQLYRTASVFLSEMGRKEESWQEFNEMKRFYLENTTPFKQSRVDSYKMLDFLIAHDEAALHYYQKDYIGAIEGWKDSIEIIKHSKPGSEEHARCYMNIANAYRYLAHYESGTKRHNYEDIAKIQYASCINLLDDKGLTDTLVKAHAHAGIAEILALNHRQHGEEYKANCKAAEKIFTLYGKEGNAYSRQMYGNLRSIYASHNPRSIMKQSSLDMSTPAGMYNSACKLKRKNKIGEAIPLFRKVIESKDFIDDKMKLDALGQLIECHSSATEWVKAKSYYDKGKELLASNPNFRQDHVDEFRVLANRVGTSCFGEPFEKQADWKQRIKDERTIQQRTKAAGIVN